MLVPVSLYAGSMYSRKFFLGGGGVVNGHLSFFFLGGGGVRGIFLVQSSNLKKFEFCRWGGGGLDPSDPFLEPCMVRGACKHMAEDERLRAKCCTNCTQTYPFFIRMQKYVY